MAKSNWPIVKAMAAVGVLMSACASQAPESKKVGSAAALFTEPCTAWACGAAPSAAEATCAPADGNCVWAVADGTTSYTQCAATACGTPPGAEVCPAGTEWKGNQCGSVDGAPCRWTTTCAPPRSTTPCPSADGCGPVPELAVICKDGTAVGLVCMKQGDACGWERPCD
jgi:hypothetical protein